MIRNTLIAGLYCFAFFYFNAHAANCKTKYVTSSVYPLNYGQWLGQMAASSGISCSESCAILSACRSFVFEPASRLCRLNAKEASSLNGGCAGSPTSVLYGRIYKATCRTQWLYGPCSAGCIVPNSYCRGGTCVCNIGFPYMHRTDSCVSSCSVYGDTFSAHPGALDGYNDGETSATSISTCYAVCIAATSYTCRSIDYIPGSSFDCYFSSETAFTKPGAYYVGSFTHAIRNCA